MKRKPNILVVMSDQQRWDSVGANGNGFVHTPNLDAMAQNGACFEHAFTPFPVCTPARASLWTGLMPNNHGLTYLRYGIEDIFNYEGKVTDTVFRNFSEAGYTTAYFGKWHLGEDSSARFTIWKGFNSRGGHWIDGKQAFQGGKYRSEQQTDDMIEFFNSDLSKDAPFFAVQSYYPPHQPYTAPTDAYAYYRGKGVPNPGYYASVTALDDHLGRLRHSLNANGLLENTLIIYTSDHGETFDLNPVNPAKFVCLDPSIRVPLLMEGPEIPQSVRPTEHVGLEDIMPTLLAYAGLESTASYDGRNILPVLAGQPIPRPDYYYVETEKLRTRTLQRCVRTAESKLIASWDESHELYDLITDPEEKLNIFDAPRSDIHDQYLHYEDQTYRIVDLAQTMLAHAKSIGDHIGIELSSRILRQRRS